MANGRGADPIDDDDEEIGPQPWPDPEPLVEPAEEEQPYPLHAMPAIMADAIAEYQQYGQQPTSLIAGSALATASLAAQGQIDVARDNQLIGPSSIYTAMIAISGERKTSCDAVFRRPLREWMLAERDRLLPEAGEAHAKIASWEAARDGLLGKIKRSSGNGTSGEADIRQFKQELVDLELNKPAEAILPNLFYEDVNPESLVLSLSEGWPSGSLWSDESGLIVGSLGMSEDSVMRFIGLLNRLWDGNDFERTRSVAKSAIVRGRRFTVCELMQPVVLAKLLALGDGASRKMGLMARFLLAWPASTMGTRSYRPPPPVMPAMAQFQHRLREILDRPLPIVAESRMILRPPALTLSAGAFELWRDFHDFVEGRIGRLGAYAMIGDIGAKMPENAARIAALFHVVETGACAGEIAAGAMEGAITLAQWYLDEARRIIDATEKPQAIADAQLLLEWLLGQHYPAIKPGNILRLGPAPLREKRRRNTAIEHLIERHCLREQRDDKATLLLLNPKLNGAAR
jgi:hypothetical protein